jgi:hypothetical protein
VIEAVVTPQAITALAKRLSTRAEALGQWRGAQQLKAIRKTPHRWRSARALWPGFAREQS